MNPKAKNRLHASKVDRIAVVDRPAVPDAMVVAFKSRDKDTKLFLAIPQLLIDKGQLLDSGGVVARIQDVNLIDYEKSIGAPSFISGFVIRSTQAAVDTLQSEIWDALYEDDIQKKIKEIFSDFETVLIDVLGKLVSKGKADEEKISREEVTGYFNRGLGYVAISAGFEFFRNNMSYLMLSYNDLAEPEATVKVLVSAFKEFVIENLTKISENKVEKSYEGVYNKAGRTLSTARLKKIKAAMDVLTEIVEETEGRYSNKNLKEGVQDMEKLDQVLSQIAGLVKSVEGLTAQVVTIENVMKEHKLIQTEDEIKADKKAKDEADVRAKADTEALEKKQKEDAEVLDKKQKEDTEILNKANVDAEERLTKMETGIESVTSVVNKMVAGLEKKFGMKTSTDVDNESINKGSKDPFADAMKNKR